MNYFAYFYCYNLFKYTTLNFISSNKKILNKTFFIGLYRFVLFLYFLYKQEN